jgi:hypothetical protein
MKNFKKIAFGLIVGVMAIGFSAFTTKSSKLAPGDFRFYSINGTSNTTASNYRFRSNPNLCSASSLVCSEVWNIGADTPSDGDLASDFATHTKVGSAVQGDYTGN